MSLGFVSASCLAAGNGDSDAENYDRLDFTDDVDFTSLPKTKCAFNHVVGVPVSTECLNQSSGRASLDDDTVDEGELKSEESDICISDSSEEGEVLSDLDDGEAKVELATTADETPWERGLRLARERLEKTKALKATEKDLAEKRMTLSVPVQVVDDELEQAAKGDVLWPGYYQVCIIGRTELTSLRFLPEDLRPPSATELAKWRLGLSDEYTGRKHRNYRRDSRRGSSETMSSASSSSRASWRSSSRDSSSVASSLASVAGSWKATCAKALRDYLSSPIRNKDRRGGRYHRGRQRSVSASSGSNSRSSDSRSGSDRSTDRRGVQRHGYGNSMGSGKVAGGVQHLWVDGKRSSRRSRSDSEQSSASRSDSQSSASRPGPRGVRQNWTHGARRDLANEDEDEEWQWSGDRSGSDSSVRRRSDVPPLPHERPVKRPWVAAPSMAAGLLTAPPSQAVVLRTHSREDSNSSAHSHSNTSPTGDDKRFITSWSKSPSSDEGQQPGAVHRQRLPDVVPGSHVSHVRRAVTPTRRRKSRSPFTIDQNQRSMGSAVPDPSHPVSEFTIPRRPTQPPPQDSREVPQLIPPALQVRQEAPREPTLVTSAQPTTTAGELPSASNRPGVRMTLAPRIKASAVDMSNLAGGVTRSTTGRTFQPSPPRVPRLPFPVPSIHRGMSPTAPNHSLSNLPTTIDQNEIRRQAEAAAAIVEERERRRAAAEAAKRRRNPNHKKRDDLSKIPIRGRPTYRRQSFSDSSLDSDSSSRTRSSSRSRTSSHSRHQSPTNISDTRFPSDARNAQMGIEHRPHKSHKRSRPTATPDYGNVGFAQDINKGNRPGTRGPHAEYSRSSFENIDSKHHRAKASREASHRHRSDRAPRTSTLTHRGVYGEYDIDQQSAIPNTGYRHREPKQFDMSNQVRHSMIYEDTAQRCDVSGRRGGMTYSQQQQLPAALERPKRPRTPHADYNEGLYDSRSPHMNVNLHRTIKNDRKRIEERESDVFTGAPSRKRALVVEPDLESELNVDLQRARSRHRSRGPGAPIDRSEPFESDAGSFAAEQRLRELRERLNLVDDAIAELKAGSASGYVDCRR